MDGADSPTRLGGNRKIGVFASRSPFRPNPIGLSAVKLEAVQHGPKGTQLIITGGISLMERPFWISNPTLFIRMLIRRHAQAMRISP